MSDTQHTAALPQTSEPRHGSRPWRLGQHVLFFGPGWFEMSTTLARTFALSMRALAKLTPRELERLPTGKSFRVELEAERGAVLLVRVPASVAAEYGVVDGQEAILILAPNADGETPEREEHRDRTLCVPISAHTQLHETKDAYYAAEQTVTALAGFALLARQSDALVTPERDRLVGESTAGPIRLLFALMRDYRSDSMRARWGHVRSILSQLYWRGRPLITSCGPVSDRTLSVRDFGPFQHGPVERWRVSRHVLEDASTVDLALARYADDLAAYEDARKLARKPRRRDSSKPRKRGKLPSKPTHPDHDKRPSTRGAVRIAPTIFEDSATHVCGQLASHIHRGVNAGPRAGVDLQLELWETMSGQAVARARTGRRRPSRRRTCAERVLRRAIARGTFCLRRHDTPEPIELSRPRGRTYLLSFESPPPRVAVSS